MSLLWTQAMPWYNGDEPEEHEEGLRPEGETLKERGQRYKQTVVDNHGVRPEVAQKAIKHVTKDLENSGSIWRDPTEYGFAHPRATTPSQLLDTPEGASKIYRTDTWHSKPVESVPLDQEPIHATQTHVKHTSVAHNLFHPGKRTPFGAAEGDPDHDPIWDHDDDWGGGFSPERKQRIEQEIEVTKHPRFLKTNDGRLHCMDGHHRVATDMLLGKRQTYGRVVHQSELEGPEHEGQGENR